MDELEQLFALMGKNIFEKRVTRAFAEIDGDESGEIEYDEFLAWFCRHARNCVTQSKAEPNALGDVKLKDGASAG